MDAEHKEIIKEKCMEVKTLKEIRPGRKLMCRKVTINGSESKHNDSNDSTVQPVDCTFLFIHGSCAASSQYDSLLEKLSEVNNSKKIHVHSYDQLGCGESKHPSNDWNAFSSSEHGGDLLAIVQSIINTMHKDSKFFITAHSYGVSQTIKCLLSMDADKLSRVDGAILIGGGLKDGPTNLTNDGGHWVFSYIPMILLKAMQPGLSRNFADAAFHPVNTRLKETSLLASSQNEMEMCKAFYRQQKYATSEEARSLDKKTMVIHGLNDMILPLAVGEHLHRSLGNSEFHAIPYCSHQVFQEEPEKVAKLMLEFVSK